MSASHFVQVIEQRQGFKIACLEELGYRNGWISKEKLMEIAVILDNTPYGKYLNLVAGKNIDRMNLKSLITLKDQSIFSKYFANTSIMETTISAVL